MRWLERVGIAFAAGALVLVPGAALAAEDTGKVCAVGVLSGGRPGVETSGNAGVTAVASAIQARKCQAGDVLEMAYGEGNLAPVVAQFCDLGRQVFIYAPPPGYVQVGITSELVCSLVVRRAGR